MSRPEPDDLLLMAYADGELDAQAGVASSGPERLPLPIPSEPCHGIWRGLVRPVERAVRGCRMVRHYSPEFYELVKKSASAIPLWKWGSSGGCDVPAGPVVLRTTVRAARSHKSARKPDNTPNTCDSDGQRSVDET